MDRLFIVLCKDGIWEVAAVRPDYETAYDVANALTVKQNDTAFASVAIVEVSYETYRLVWFTQVAPDWADAYGVLEAAAHVRLSKTFGGDDDD